MTLQDTLPTCRCGCGQTITRPGYRFLSGSHLRKRFTLIERFWLYVDKDERPGACWLWAGGRTQSGPYGYGAFTVGPAALKAHRLAYELASGQPIPDGLDILHTCDIPLCVRNDGPGVYEVDGILLPRWGHLALGTHADNMADAARKDKWPHEPHPVETRARGERAGSAKLTENDVREIRQLHALTSNQSQKAPTRWTLQRLADRFGVANHTIYMIVANKLWKHVF